MQNLGGGMDFRLSLLQKKEKTEGQLNKNSSPSPTNVIESNYYSMLEKTHKGVNGALTKIDDGNFGNCVDCGERIPEERLIARPWAERCLNCQQKKDLSSPSPRKSR